MFETYLYNKFLWFVADVHEVNITEVIQKQVGNSMYTSILAKYASVPEKLLQWYLEQQPIRANTIYKVKNDGLNSVLTFRHTPNQTFGTFTLKVNGTDLMDSIKLPSANKMSSIVNPAQSLLKKVMKILGFTKSTSQLHPNHSRQTRTLYEDDKTWEVSSQPQPAQTSFSSSNILSPANLKNKVQSVIGYLKNWIVNNDTKRENLETESVDKLSSKTSPVGRQPFSNQYFQSTEKHYTEKNNLSISKQADSISSHETSSTQLSTESTLPISAVTGYIQTSKFLPEKPRLISSKVPKIR